MIGPAHHVGIAVHRLEPAIERYRLMGLALEYVDTVPGAGVRVAFLASGGVHVELIEPTDPNGTVARFLERRGEGLHHLAFSTTDIESELARLEHDGFKLIDRTPRAGARGRRVAFVNPKSAHGVLVELVQEAEPTS